MMFLLRLLSVVSFSTYLCGTSCNEEESKVNFLMKNVTEATCLPKSFYIPKGYWQQVHEDPLNEENRNERILATYGQNIYDGATWQIALAMMGKTELASKQTGRLMSGRSGDMLIKASDKAFLYGDGQKQCNQKESFFFRMISDEWAHSDPLTNESVGWMDWKPILGENAWATLIAPLQVAYIKYQGHIPLNCQEVKLALNILPTLQAMQSPIGGLYHCTGGVYGKDPHDISSENNASLYAGLQMLRQVLEENHDNSTRLTIVDQLLQGIEQFFKEYAYDATQECFVQGGVYDPHTGQFHPSTDFAVDVQTWGVTVLGAEKIDSWFDPGTSYRIWLTTKKKGGYYQNQGELAGVGYSDTRSEVLSVEWTLGAILLVKELYNFYGFSDLVNDAATMRQGIESLKEEVILEGEITTAYHYANKRYYIPFGWWANPIPSITSTAWVLMIDHDFNPFILGGKGL